MKTPQPNLASKKAIRCPLCLGEASIEFDALIKAVAKAAPVLKMSGEDFRRWLDQV